MTTYRPVEGEGDAACRENGHSRSGHIEGTAKGIHEGHGPVGKRKGEKKVAILA